MHYNVRLFSSCEFLKYPLLVDFYNHLWKDPKAKLQGPYLTEEYAQNNSFLGKIQYVINSALHCIGLFFSDYQEKHEFTVRKLDEIITTEMDNAMAAMQNIADKVITRRTAKHPDFKHE